MTLSKRPIPRGHGILFSMVGKASQVPCASLAYGSATLTEIRVRLMSCGSGARSGMRSLAREDDLSEGSSKTLLEALVCRRVWAEKRRLGGSVGTLLGFGRLTPALRWAGAGSTTGTCAAARPKTGGTTASERLLC